MLHSPIHRAQLTPSQRLRAIERQARRERFEQSAISRVHEVVELPPDKTEMVELPIADVAPPELPDPESLVADWVDRQRAIHKPLWFGIVDEVDTPVKKKISIIEIQRACANHYGVTVRAILSAARTADIVRPRQVAVYLSEKLTRCSLKEIGRRFGGKDHSTQIHSMKKIAHLIETEPGMRETVQHLARNVGGELA